MIFTRMRFWQCNAVAVFCAGALTASAALGQPPAAAQTRLQGDLEMPWIYPGNYYSPVTPDDYSSITLSRREWLLPTRNHPYPSWYVPGPFAPLPFKDTMPYAPADKGVIKVFLPVVNADVYLNGEMMIGSGKNRTLTTPLLPTGSAYQYYVTMKYQENGQTITEYRKVDVGPGEYTVADFTRPPLDNPGKLPAGPVDPNEVVPGHF